MIEGSVQTQDLGAPALAEAQDLIPEQPNLDLTPENSNETSRFRKLLAATTRAGHLATRSAQTALVLLEVSPANEAVRLGAWGATEAIVHSPVTGALSLGLSTLGVEAVGALAGAPLLDTGPSKRVANFLNEKLSKVSKDTEQPEFSQLTKVGTAYVGGSVAAMALDKIENPNSTVERSRRFGLWTSTWLAGVLAVQGAAGSEGANLLGLSGPEAAGIVAGAVGAGAIGGWLRRQFKNRSKNQGGAIKAETIRDIDSENGMLFELINDKHKLEEAAQLEMDVWLEKGYGSLEEYADHIVRARTFAAFKDGKCVGVTRMFGGESKLPPFTELTFDNNSYKSQIIKDCKKGLIEEVGTLAVAPEHRGSGMIAVHLQRLAYRDARARGIKSWGIIMEPERVQKMNERYGFTFKQLGPAVDYQAGMCAPHIMDLEEVDQAMSEKLPEIYKWFVNEPLGKLV
jgi:predicted outer membrane repeat protein